MCPDRIRWCWTLFGLILHDRPFERPHTPITAAQPIGLHSPACLWTLYYLCLEKKNINWHMSNPTCKHNRARMGREKAKKRERQREKERRANINTKANGLRVIVYSNNPAMKPISFYRQLEVWSFGCAGSIAPIQRWWCPDVRMPASPLAMMVHFLDVATQYQELEGNLNFWAVDFVTAVTSVMVLAAQVVRQLELVVNRIPFEYHTTFPNLHFGKKQNGIH